MVVMEEEEEEEEAEEDLACVEEERPVGLSSLILAVCGTDFRHHVQKHEL